jgi:hypothetical protein
VTTEARRAHAAFALADASGAIGQSGEAEAVIGDDASASARSRFRFSMLILSLPPTIA